MKLAKVPYQIRNYVNNIIYLYYVIIGQRLRFTDYSLQITVSTSMELIGNAYSSSA